jgi:hypothetical protein
MRYTVFAKDNFFLAGEENREGTNLISVILMEKIAQILSNTFATSLHPESIE